MYNLAIRKCTSPPLKIKIYYPAGDWTPVLQNQRQTCYHLSQCGESKTFHIFMTNFLLSSYHNNVCLPLYSVFQFLPRYQLIQVVTYCLFSFNKSRREAGCITLGRCSGVRSRRWRQQKQVCVLDHPVCILKYRSLMLHCLICPNLQSYHCMFGSKFCSQFTLSWLIFLNIVPTTGSLTGNLYLSITTI